MGEALLVKYGGAAEKTTIIQPDSCALIVTVLDPLGRPVPANTPVNCNDSGQWYNYETNENGQVLFRIRTGTCGMTAFSWRNRGNDRANVKYIDVRDTAATISGCTVNTQMNYNLKFRGITESPISWGADFKNNIQFLWWNTTDCLIIGAGGAGTAMSAGYGAACNISHNITVDRNTIYSISVGMGSRGTGGTTSALGLSAVGGSSTAAGGSGNFRGGIPTTSYWSSEPNYNNTTVSPFTLSSRVGYGGYNGLLEMGIYVRNRVQDGTYYNFDTGVYSAGTTGHTTIDRYEVLAHVTVYFKDNEITYNTNNVCMLLDVGDTDNMRIFRSNLNNTAYCASNALRSLYADTDLRPSAGAGGCMCGYNVSSTRGGNGYIYLRRNT